MQHPLARSLTYDEREAEERVFVEAITNQYESKEGVAYLGGWGGEGGGPGWGLGPGPGVGGRHTGGHGAAWGGIAWGGMAWGSMAWGSVVWGVWSSWQA